MTLLLALDFLKSLEFINSSCDFIKSDVYVSMCLCVYASMCLCMATLYCVAP